MRNKIIIKQNNYFKTSGLERESEMRGGGGKKCITKNLFYKKKLNLDNDR